MIWEQNFKSNNHKSQYLKIINKKNKLIKIVKKVSEIIVAAFLKKKKCKINQKRINLR